MGMGQGTPPVPPGPAVFGGAQRVDPNAPQLTLSLQALGGYDDNIAGEQGGVSGAADPRRQVASSFAGGGGSLHFNQARRRVRYGGNIGGQYRSLFDVDLPGQRAVSAGGNLAMDLSRRSTLALAGHIALQPFFQFGAVGGLDAGAMAADVSSSLPLFDFQASPVEMLSHGVSATYGYELGSRTTFQALASRTGYAPFDQEDDRGLVSLATQQAGARIMQRVSPNLGVRVGYFYQTFDRPSLSTQVADEAHNIDLGLDYARSFSFARRTTFAMSTGSSIVRSSRPFATDEGPRTHFIATGNATLARGFAQTWSAHLGYNRSLNYITGLNAFGVNDSVMTGLGGLLSDRLDMRVFAQYLTGTLGLGGGGERYQMGGAGLQMRYALTRNLALFTSYNYTRFAFPESLSLPRGFASRADRHGVRVGLTSWFDLLR